MLFVANPPHLALMGYLLKLDEEEMSSSSVLFYVECKAKRTTAASQTTVMYYIGTDDNFVCFLLICE